MALGKFFVNKEDPPLFEWDAIIVGAICIELLPAAILYTVQRFGHYLEFGGFANKEAWSLSEDDVLH